jgi:uncharacterized SAM-binding protein YcdF (DUF218 family)
MFFVLSKMVSFLLKPFFYILLFLVLSMLPKFARFSRRLRTASLVLIVIFGNHVLLNEILIAWEISPNNVEPTKTVVVLGGYTSFDRGRQRMGFNEAAERFVFPLQMLSSGKTNRLVLTGGSGNVFNRDYFESSAAKQFALKFGIADSQILIDDKSRNTWENAIETKKILDSLGIKENVLLVTSAGHMRRSMACFKKAGVNFIPYPVNFQSHLDRKYSWDAMLIPSAGNISKWDALIHEWIGYIAYKLTGKA